MHSQKFALCTRWTDSLPKSVDTAGMTTELIDDIKVIDPGSIAIEVLDCPLFPGMLPNTPPKQTGIDGSLHDDGFQTLFR